MKFATKRQFWLYTLRAPDFFSPRIRFLGNFCSPFLKFRYLFSFHENLYPFSNEYIHSEYPISKIASCSLLAPLTLDTVGR